MTKQTNVIWRSLLITLLIFTSGIMLNHFFDTFRIDTITSVIRTHELDTYAYNTQRIFTETFGGEQCNVMTQRISILKAEIRKVGEDLGSYSRFSFFRKKDYDYLKRKYFLLELNFLSTLNTLNKQCDNPYLPILFFYQIDQEDSERQGFILQELSDDHEHNVVILPIDKDYKDEPLVQLLVENYNVTTAPTLVIENDIYTGLQYTRPLNDTINAHLLRADPYARHINFHTTPEAADISLTMVTQELEKTLNMTSDAFARGDLLLAIGRLKNDNKLICASLLAYEQSQTTNAEERALLHETIASVGCGRSRTMNLRQAAQLWKTTGNTHRADILNDILSGNFTPRFDMNAVNANTSVITGYKTAITPLVPTNKTSVTIGNTTATLTNSTILVSQDDRVYRDWLSGQITNPYGSTLLGTFSERLTYDNMELRPDIGWHEGARIKELKQTGLTHLIATGTLAASYDGHWYGIDDMGTFRFEIPLDKISYPTTRFLREDLAVLIDTHGINMLVEQAIRNNATTVIGCCDHPGKIYAIDYLSKHNITTICYPDKYLFLAIGHNTSALGSPPQLVNSTEAIIGNRPLTLTLNDTIIVTNASDNAYALWYYQAPASYFDVITRAIPLNVIYVNLTDFNQTSKIVIAANEHNANIIATRVYNRIDYTVMKDWLNANMSHKAILFHSAPYPYGQLLFREYPNQTSFDDPNPVFT